MFKIEELSGSLIKSGRFQDAIKPFFTELDHAASHRVITKNELLVLQTYFCNLLLRPDATFAADLGDKMIKLMMRVPNYIKTDDEVSEEEFAKNVKNCREA